MTSRRDGQAWSPARWSYFGEMEILRDAVADTHRGRLHGIAGQVCVPGGRLHLGVTEQLADHREPFAKRQGPGREAMAEVMDAHAVELGTRPDAAPRVSKVGEVAPRFLAGDHPRIVLFARQ